ncbi:MAG: polyribonucleotide nucleotidyltransferase [Chlamydiia bacterium]|nr:polyribonucleotide nucleotidyltransferase [Chlamydiia bacterium]MCP5491655.1 polyribonucleotide nucleotidyltransferase [Chlamydiales bacterium]
MELKRETLSVTIAGREMTFETGKIARQAGGCVLVRCGETIVMGTACANPTGSDDIDFLPLRVDYTEKFSAAGKTLGGFIKREGRPKEREILVSRLIDRPLRPMFEEGYYNETQVLAYVLSYDNEHAPEPLAICAASAALVLSEIPLIKPVGAVRVGMINDNFVINPTVTELKESKLDLLIAGTEDAILMIEGFCDFLTEEQVLEAVNEGQKAIRTICEKLADWQKVLGKPKMRDIFRIPPKELHAEIEKICGGRIDEHVRIKQKALRDESIAAVKEDVMAQLFPEGEVAKFNKVDANISFKKYVASKMRNMILTDKVRADGRNSEEIRPIDIELDLLPRTHGSALFTRGETQTIAVCTLGGGNMAQRFEHLEEEGEQHFYLQYSFPPFSVGEVGRMGAPGRREVGHGKLAERALAPLIPSREVFPYTIRVESNITESNGSSSMASICGGCIALMRAGVPIKRPVAGIAMGLILDSHERFAVLSDILGMEDALGDMDFKIAGDEKGITAFQLDIKIEGITPKIMQTALMQAKEGRIHILNKMLHACPIASESLSKYAPRIETVKVAPSKIGTVIGPGGKMIREITETSGAEINIDDDGLVSITCTSAEGMEKAKEMIHNLTAEPEVGKVYTGKITSVTDFGVFVQIYSQEGLCHVSELSYERIDNVQDHYKVGEMLEVKYVEKTDRGVRLSRKVLLPKPEGYVEQERAPRPPRDRNSRPPRRDGGNRSDDRGGDRKPTPLNIIAPPPLKR